MYPKKLKILGDHIRARRLDLGLLQKDVAEIIGVTTDTITNWEKNRTKPMYWHYPRITEFLGYCPFERLNYIGERLRRNRFYQGLSQDEMAQRLGTDPRTLSRNERQKNR